MIFGLILAIRSKCLDNGMYEEQYIQDVQGCVVECQQSYADLDGFCLPYGYFNNKYWDRKLAIAPVAPRLSVTNFNANCTLTPLSFGFASGAGGYGPDASIPSVWPAVPTTKKVCNITFNQMCPDVTNPVYSPARLACIANDPTACGVDTKVFKIVNTVCVLDEAGAIVVSTPKNAGKYVTKVNQDCKYPFVPTATVCANCTNKLDPSAAAGSQCVASCPTAGNMYTVFHGSVPVCSVSCPKMGKYQLESKTPAYLDMSVLSSDKVCLNQSDTMYMPAEYNADQSKFATYKCPDTTPNLDVSSFDPSTKSWLHFSCVDTCKSTFLMKNRVCYPYNAGTPMISCDNKVGTNYRCDFPRMFEQLWKTPVTNAYNCEYGQVKSGAGATACTAYGAVFGTTKKVWRLDPTVTFYEQKSDCGTGQTAASSSGIPMQFVASTNGICTWSENFCDVGTEITKDVNTLKECNCSSAYPTSINMLVASDYTDYRALIDGAATESLNYYQDVYQRFKNKCFAPCPDSHPYRFSNGSCTLKCDPYQYINATNKTCMDFEKDVFGHVFGYTDCTGNTELQYLNDYTTIVCGTRNQVSGTIMASFLLVAIIILVVMIVLVARKCGRCTQCCQRQRQIKERKIDHMVRNYVRE